MNKTRSSDLEIVLEDLTVPLFGYELIREELLSNILGKDAPDILYWSGKHIARSHPLTSLTEVSSFFEKAGWGTLSLKKELKNEYHFELTSPLISSRLQGKKETHFKLEAGFLAQQIEIQKNMVAEAFEQIQRKLGLVEIIVRWDYKDIINK